TGDVRDEQPALPAEHVDLAHQHEVRPEHPGLLIAALRELGAADPAGEPEVVADQRAGPGLPADRLLLDDQGGQALGRPVHRGREAGRTAADDEYVELPLVL